MFRNKRMVVVLAAVVALAAGCSDDSTGDNNNNTPQDAGVDDAEVDSGPEGLDLDLGELVTVEPDASGMAEVTLITSSGDEEFLILLQSRADGLNVERAFTGGLPQQMARRVTTPADRRAQWGCLSGGGHVDLAKVVQGLAGREIPRGHLDPPGPRPAPPPNEGETVDFQIDTDTGVVTVACEVLLVSDSLVVVLDRDTDPSLELDATKLDEIAAGFEDIVLPRERIFFGQESDVNDDGHVTVLFSPLVYDSATAYVNPYDLVTDPAARPPGVAANNQELLYVTPPQMLPPHMGTTRGIIETLAHEFQHAIYFYRKYQLNDIMGDPESAYITEGLSALAQDLTGYQAGNFFVSLSGLFQMDQISINDLVASTGAYFPPERDGPLRGGAYHMMRYLYDQAGGDRVLADGTIDVPNSPGVPWLRALVDSPLLGVANIEAAAGQPLVDIATDWYTAQMVDDRTDSLDQPLNTDPLYNFLPTVTDPLTGRTRGTTMFESFAGQSKTGPLVREFLEADGAIRPGGAEYLHLAASGSPTTSFVLGADPEYVDILLVILRTR